MKQPLTVGSLFSGIGGFDLGFERAGFKIRWMCEINPSCRKELAKHWPEVPIYEDVRSIRGSDFGREGGRGRRQEADVSNADDDRQRAAQQVLHVGLSHAQGCRVVEPVDVLIGGFPCQDISLAGRGAGLDGARSGLWWEFYRLIGELRPRYVCLENVAALIVRGLPAILGALSEIGYDAEWQIVSAASLGAPHLRERLFVVAYPEGERSGEEGGFRRKQSTQRPSSRRQDVPNLLGPRLEIVERQPGDDVTQRSPAQRNNNGWQYWAVEPPVGRMAHGIPRRVDRLKSLGNAVVPQVAEYVGRCIQRHAEANPTTDIGG